MDAMCHACHIIDCHYKKSYLCKVPSESKYLSEEEHEIIHEVLIRYGLIFDGTTGACKKKPVDI